MQTEQYKFPAGDNGAMGLGWILEDWPGGAGVSPAERTKVCWHNGGTIGQYSYLYVIPGRRFAMCVLTNADSGPPLVDAICKEVLSERLGIARPPQPEMPTEPVVLDLEKYRGKFERMGVKIEIEPQDGNLVVTMRVSIIEGLPDEPQIMPVSPMDEERFAVVDGEGKVQ